jgi:hypothetical protein
MQKLRVWKTLCRSLIFKTLYKQEKSAFFFVSFSPKMSVKKGAALGEKRTAEKGCREGLFDE